MLAAEKFIHAYIIDSIVAKVVKPEKKKRNEMKRTKKERKKKKKKEIHRLIQEFKCNPNDNMRKHPN